MPPIHGENGMVYADAEKAKIFAESLELQCSPNFNEDIRRRLRQEGETLKKAPGKDLNLKVKRAPGSDSIGQRALLLAYLLAIVHLSHFPIQ